ncbi:MAG: DNA repair protein RadA [Thermoflexales bacterium]
MPKRTPQLRTQYVCTNCHSTFPRWSGKCPACGAWNTLVEEVVADRPTVLMRESMPLAHPRKLAEILSDTTERLPLPIQEFTRVLGGGIVPGSLVLIGGDPGIGKSTLLLQAAVLTARYIGPTLYVSGEESSAQIKMRAERLGVGDSDLYLLTETNLEVVVQAVERLRPHLCVVDSIQTMFIESLQSSPGSVTQVRECAQQLQALAKRSGTAIFIVGHVTKEGTLAGPKVLEHIVDTVLQLEGDRFQAFRILRATKNRFGATNEVGVFEMTSSGMCEVSNPSEAFLAERLMHAPGSAIAATMEGTRPLLLEVQALASPTPNPLPRRTANGFDYNRLFLLVAVLSKRLGLRLHNQDVFVNVVGGMTIEEPAADLAAALAIVSAAEGVPIPADTALVGEIGLSGEVRSVANLGQRLGEAARLGFARCVIPKTTRKLDVANGNMQLVPVRSVGEAVDRVLGS